MIEYNKPLPQLTATSRVFYDACREGRLLYQQCRDCNEIIFFPKELCSNCLGENIEWKESKGKGTLYTFTITRDFAPPAFMDAVPYCLALVNLDEGFPMLTNMMDCNFDDLRCDMPVEVVFDPITPEITLPRFKPAG